jgi:L-rhamnose mutarotase
MKTYCLALDLQDDTELIAEYKRYHEPENIWPEVVANTKGQGIVSQEIYLLGTRNGNGAAHNGRLLLRS